MPIRMRKSDVASTAGLKRIKSSTSTTMEWLIPDFRPVTDLETKYQSSGPFLLKWAKVEFIFQLHIEVTKDKVGFFLENLSWIEVEVDLELKAIDKLGTAFVCRNMTQKKFKQSDWSFGCHNFISLKNLKENADNLYPNGCLRLECNVTISDAEASTEDYEGPTLKEDLVGKLYKKAVVTDYSINCNGQVFPCHKTILAAR